MSDKSVITLQAYDGKATLDLFASYVSAAGYTAMAYVIPQQIGQPGHASLDRLQVLNRADWDVSYHANKDHDLTALSADELHRELKIKRDWLIRHGFARGSRHAAPYEFAVAAREYAALTAAGFLSIIGPNATYTLSPNPAFTLVQQTASDNILWATVQAAITTAVATPNTILWLGFHDVVADTPTGLDTTVDRLQKVLKAVNDSGLQVVTFSDMIP